jgi:hypothetical protein
MISLDALHYANITWHPKTIINVATLTGAIGISLGQMFSGVFTVRILQPWFELSAESFQNSNELWDELNVAGEAEFDRLWRMPLDEEFGPQIYSSNADLCNVSAIFAVTPMDWCVCDRGAERKVEAAQLRSSWRQCLWCLSIMSLMCCRPLWKVLMHKHLRNSSDGHILISLWVDL